MAPKKAARIGSRIDPKLRTRLDEISRRYGPNDSTMLEDALTALADYVEKNNSYRRPVMMVFDAETDEKDRLKFAEAAVSLGAVGTAATSRLRKEEQERAGKLRAAHK